MTSPGPWGDGLPGSDIEPGTWGDGMPLAPTASRPKVVSAVCLNCYTINVTYDMEVEHVDPLGAADALNPLNYAFAGPTTIKILWINVVTADPTVVRLVVKMTGGMVPGVGNYSVTVSNVKSMAGLVIDPAADTAIFNGIYCPALPGSGGGGGGAAGPGAGGGTGGGSGIPGATEGEDAGDAPQWHTANFGQMIPDGLDDILTGVTAVVSPVLPVLDSMADALKVLAAYLVDGAVPDFLGGLQLLVDQIRNALFGSGFYYLSMWDYAVLQFQKEMASQRLGTAGLLSSRVNFRRFLSDMVQTLNDQADLDRPTFTGRVDAFIMVVGAPAPREFVQLYGAVASLFPSDREVAKVEDAIKILVDELEGTTPAPLRESIPPDWENVTTGDILSRSFPALADFLNNSLDQLLNALQTAKDASGVLLAMIDLLKKKIKQLEEMLNSLVALVAALEAILAAMGIYVLYASSSDGINGLKQVIQQAQPQPFEGVDVYVSGCMFLVGSEGTAVFNTIFGLV